MGRIIRNWLGELDDNFDYKVLPDDYDEPIEDDDVFRDDPRADYIYDPVSQYSRET